MLKDICNYANNNDEISEITIGNEMRFRSVCTLFIQERIESISTDSESLECNISSSRKFFKI